MHFKSGQCLFEHILYWHIVSFTTHDNAKFLIGGLTNRPNDICKRLAIVIADSCRGALVAEWLSSWLAEQEDRGSIPGLASRILRDSLSPAFKSRYG